MFYSFKSQTALNLTSCKTEASVSFLAISQGHSQILGVIWHRISWLSSSIFKVNKNSSNCFCTVNLCCPFLTHPFPAFILTTLSQVLYFCPDRVYFLVLILSLILLSPWAPQALRIISLLVPSNKN